MSDNKAFYEFRAPQYVDFTPTKPESNKSAYFDDVFERCGGNMDMDFSLHIPSEPSIRWSSTPNKRDSCTQTPSERTEQEEAILSEALDTILCLERVNNRRSVRFNEAIDVCPTTPNTSVAEKLNRADPNSFKRNNTPFMGRTWHQALKYRSVEQRVATPKPDGRRKRDALLAEPTLKRQAERTPSSVPRIVKVRVDPKPTIKVEPFKLTSYKPKQSPIEDPKKIFLDSKSTPVRPMQAKQAVRRLSLADKVESTSTPPFRARPPVSLYQKPFVPRHSERPPIKVEPFRLYTEERAKKREEYDYKIQQHLLALEVERQRVAAEREREDALQLKESRKVKFHARPVPAFVYSRMMPTPTSDKSPKTPALTLPRPRTTTRTI